VLLELAAALAWTTLTQPRRRGRVPRAPVPRGTAADAGRRSTAGDWRRGAASADGRGRRRWSALPDLPTPRHGLGAVAYGGAIYVLEGGTSPGFSCSATVERLVVVAASRASISLGLSL
jgi:hypothetical protein